MSDPTPGEKKIIVDEDWKSQVEAEREAMRAHDTEAPGDAPGAAAPGAAAPSGATDAAGSGPSADRATRLPPPDLLFLATSIYYQAMAALGLLPHPLTNKPEVNLPLARHTIDTLQVLWDKTEGNRTPQESETMDAMLHDLRMACVAVGSSPQSPPPATGA